MKQVQKPGLAFSGRETPSYNTMLSQDGGLGHGSHSAPMRWPVDATSGAPA